MLPATTEPADDDMGKGSALSGNAATAELNLSPENTSLPADHSEVSPPPVAIEGTRSRSPWRGRQVWLLVPGAMLVGMAWYASGFTDPLLGLFRGPSVESPVAAAPSLPAGASELDLARVLERITAAGFNDVVRAALRRDGRIEVAGVLESVDDQDQLIQLLSPERRWLALALLTQAEFAERVRDTARLLPEGFGAEPLTGGRIRLTGLVLRPEEGALARAILEERLPQTVAMVNGLSTPDDVAAQLGASCRGWALGRSKSHGVMPGSALTASFPASGLPPGNRLCSASTSDSVIDCPLAWHSSCQTPWFLRLLHRLLSPYCLPEASSHRCDSEWPVVLPAVCGRAPRAAGWHGEWLPAGRHQRYRASV